MIVTIAFGILYLGGLDWRLFLGLLLLLPIGLSAILVAAPYRLQRLVAFLDPWSDPFGKGYQLSHSLIAFGRGEWIGVGLGSSVEKLLYLPEAHTDFLLAVTAEELGFAGVALVIGLFVWLLFRTYAIGRQAARLGRAVRRRSSRSASASGSACRRSSTSASTWACCRRRGSRCRCCRSAAPASSRTASRSRSCCAWITRIAGCCEGFPV